jgi:hypothetical protein
MTLIAKAISATNQHDGQITQNLSSPFEKNILIFRIGDSDYIPRHPVPEEGALAIVTERWDGIAVDAAASCARWDGRAE